jgi:2-desacetyl-2-hydroxyethyl bacteriochlorophyllide A dehydrogenase
MAPSSLSTSTARAFWLEAPGQGRILEETLAPLPEGWCLIETEWSAISPGTERLVALGRVPAEAHSAMRCQYMAGEFTFPLKYGYSLVGRCVEGPSPLLGRRVHAMHPHQDRCLVEARAAFPVPDGVPAQRATLASNLETAVNALWDADAQVGERAAVVGFGIVGSLVARLFSMIPGTEVLVIEADPEKRKAAQADGFSVAAGLAEAGAFDLAFEASGSPDGLQTALDAVGREGRVVLLSWYGDREVRLRLGSDFHFGRKRIVSSQVSTLPGGMLSRWDFTRRKQLVFRLLLAPIFDRHISQILKFEDLSEFFYSLCNGGYRGLSAAVQF